MKEIEFLIEHYDSQYHKCLASASNTLDVSVYARAVRFNETANHLRQQMKNENHIEDIKRKLINDAYETDSVSSARSVELEMCRKGASEFVHYMSKLDSAIDSIWKPITEKHLKIKTLCINKHNNKMFFGTIEKFFGGFFVRCKDIEFTVTHFIEDIVNH